MGGNYRGVNYHKSLNTESHGGYSFHISIDSLPPCLYLTSNDPPFNTSHASMSPTIFMKVGTEKRETRTVGFTIAAESCRFCESRELSVLQPRVNGYRATGDSLSDDWMMDIPLEYKSFFCRFIGLYF